jgi:hypothetical protein
MLKQFKIITLAPTCFGSRRNQHQGAVLCLAKTTKYGFTVLVSIDAVNVMAAYQPVVQACGLPARLHNRLIFTAPIPMSTEKPYFVVLAKHRTAP